MGISEPNAFENRSNEYKDYIPGFIFYKYLSDREVGFLRENGLSDQDIEQLPGDSELKFHVIGLHEILISKHEYQGLRAHLSEPD